MSPPTAYRSSGNDDVSLAIAFERDMVDLNFGWDSACKRRHREDEAPLAGYVEEGTVTRLIGIGAPVTHVSRYFIVLQEKW